MRSQLGWVARWVEKHDYMKRKVGKKKKVEWERR
jgi:hypothetical protein